MRTTLFAVVATLAPLLSFEGLAQPAETAKEPGKGASQSPGQNAGKIPGQTPGAAGDIADFFSQVGDQILEDCIYELSEEQREVQKALIEAYVKHGAPNILARQLAVKQIRPPRLSEKCKRIKNQNVAMTPTSPAPAAPGASPWAVKTTPTEAPRKPQPEPPALASTLSDKKLLALWDCAPGVDYVTIMHKGYERKLSDGEICSPLDDVVRSVPDAAKTFKLGYTIKTGRLFIVSDDTQMSGRTIAWAISGRDACRNNPDPDCLAARAVGPLPPGEYSFASDPDHRVSWGPKTRRMVAGIYMTKLWHRERYSPAQTQAILARGNIAIHVRLKGEMSEACLGLGPNGWGYVSNLIKDGRATGVNVYIDEPYPLIAEHPPIMKASSFSLSSLFKQ